MRVLIIGCGYIGLPLGAKLASLGHAVSGLRRNRTAEARLIAANIKPLFADITDADTLVKLPREFDWVVNCVASGGGDAEEYRELYLQGTRNIIAWLAPAGVSKFVYTSSTSVYGQNDGSMVDETSPVEPATDTARVLIETENVVLDAFRKENFPAILLRVAGIYGPERGYWFKKFVDGTARLEGEGHRILNMIHRDDVAGSIIAALRHGQSGEIYIAVDDEPVTQSDFFSWLSTQLGRPMPDSTPITQDPARKRGVTNKKISNRKLKAELNYRFAYPTFREGYAAEIKRVLG